MYEGTKMNEIFFSKYEWLYINKEQVFKNIIGNKNIKKLRTFSKLLYKLKCSLENIWKTVKFQKEVREGKFKIETFCCTEKKIEIWTQQNISNSSYTGLDRPWIYGMLRIPECIDSRQVKVVRLSTLSSDCLDPRSAAGRIKSMKSSNDIRNRTRDLPACKVLP
jgi:hypothetical protein